MLQAIKHNIERNIPISTLFKNGVAECKMHFIVLVSVKNLKNAQL
jgi:hypothetical protein